MFQVKLLLLNLTVTGDERNDMTVVGDDRRLPEAPFILSFRCDYPVTEAFLRLCRGERLSVRNPAIAGYIKEEPSVIMTDRPMVLDYIKGFLYIPE